MTHGLYIASSAAVARSRQLDAVASDLVNAETPGYRASRTAFEAALRDVEGSEAPSDKTLARALDLGVDDRPGRVLETGRDLDVRLGDGAFLAVAVEGGVAYTRSGRLALEPSGQLVVDGRPVLDGAGAHIVVPQGAQPTIRADGTVVAGGAPLASLGAYVLGGELERAGPSLVRPVAPELVEARAPVVDVGALELSSVAPVDAMVQLIGLQRGFAHAMQAIDTYASLDRTANQLGRVG